MHKPSHKNDWHANRATNIIYKYDDLFKFKKNVFLKQADVFLLSSADYVTALNDIY